MAGERDKKLQRLDSLRKQVPYCSQNALSAILANVAEHGVPALHSKKHVQEANRKVLEQCTGYGPLFKTVQLRTLGGEETPMTMVNVFSLLAGIYKSGGAFADLMKSTMARDGSLQLALYADEVTPGNVLSSAASRKIWTVYCSFGNFPAHILSNESFWLTICVQRTAFVNTLSANMSQVFKAILQEIFENDSANPAHGLLLKGKDDDHLRLIFTPGLVVQDGLAHKYIWSIKGDSGSKFCLLCRNCVAVSRAGEFEDEDMNGVCRISKHSDLSLATDAEVWASMARMKEKYRSCNKATFEKWQQATGTTFSMHSVLAHEPFRNIVQPIAMYMHDWMHCCLSNGCLSLVCWLVLNVLHGAGLTVFKTLPGYLAKWSLPKAMSTVKIADMFSAKRLDSCKAADKLKSSASEMLTFHVVFVYYLRTCVAPCCSVAYSILCVMLDLV